MFPRLSRLLRLALLVLGLVLFLFLFLVLKTAPGNGGPDSGEVLYVRHVPAPAFRGPLASTAVRYPRWMSTLKAGSVSSNVDKQRQNGTAASAKMLEAGKLGDFGRRQQHQEQAERPAGATNDNSGRHSTMPTRTTLQDKDIVNPHNFRYLLNPGETACHLGGGGGGAGSVDPSPPSDSDGQGDGQNGSEADRGQGHGHIGLLVYVHAAPANLKKRQSIRQTWGDRGVLQRYNASLVFIMGRVEDARLMQLVKMESERYGDIVQEDFLDSYRNLTYKAIAGLRWAATFCSEAAYILKSDDDILVNIHRLVKHIREVVAPTYGKERLILCNQWLRMKILRERKSKWYVPEDEFPGDYFPPYCSGSAFLLSGDMAQRMFEASLTSKFFWVDDYYITGALIKALDIKHRRLNQAYSLNPTVAEGKYLNDTKHELFFFHLHKLRLLYQLWAKMSKEASFMEGDEAHVTTDLPRVPRSLRTKAVYNRGVASQHLHQLVRSNESSAESYRKSPTNDPIRQIRGSGDGGSRNLQNADNPSVADVLGGGAGDPQRTVADAGSSGNVVGSKRPIIQRTGMPDNPRSDRSKTAAPEGVVSSRKLYALVPDLDLSPTRAEIKSDSDTVESTKDSLSLRVHRNR